MLTGSGRCPFPHTQNHHTKMSTPQYASTKIENPTERYEVKQGYMMQRMEWHEPKGDQLKGQWIPATSKVVRAPACRPLMVGEFKVMQGMKDSHFPIIRLSAFGLSNATFMVLDGDAQSRLIEAHA